MKSFNEFMNSKYVSLKGLDDEVVERLSNIDGLKISECMSANYCLEPCGEPECCPCEDPYSVAPGNTPGAYPQSQSQGINLDPLVTAKSKFYGQPKVYDLLDTHQLLDYKYRFISEYQRSLKEPVLFYDYVGVQYNDSEKLRDDVLTLCNDFELLWPVLIIKGDGTIQLFAAKKFGSNGEECSIKSSLINAADILGKLEKRKEIEWAQVLDVSIDNLDDLYDFLFTVTFNKERYDKELEDKKERELRAVMKAKSPTNIMK